MSKGKEIVLSCARGLWGPGGYPGTNQPSSLMGLTADIPLRHCHIQMRLEIIKCLSSNRASEDGQPPACPLWVQASSSTAGKVLAWRGRKVILSLSKQVKTDGMLLHLPCNSHSLWWLFGWCCSCLESPSPFLAARQDDITSLPCAVVCDVKEGGAL